MSLFLFQRHQTPKPQMEITAPARTAPNPMPTFAPSEREAELVEEEEGEVGRGE